MTKKKTKKKTRTKAVTRNNQHRNKKDCSRMVRKAGPTIKVTGPTIKVAIILHDDNVFVLIYA